jgi:DNA-binding MarR family transcriptional regulator
MAEPAEGARLLSECGGKLPPRVRIPLSPPYKKQKPNLKAGWAFVFFCLTSTYSLIIVHTMNYLMKNAPSEIPKHQVAQFQQLITKLYQCCQDRMRYQSERFKLPDAELRCLLLFGEEKYLTPKGIAAKMNLAKSRISKLISGLNKKGFVQKIADPEDSRTTLLRLTSQGQKKLNEINDFLNETHQEVLRHMEPEQRHTMMTNLELLKASMESIKELMV